MTPLLLLLQSWQHGICRLKDLILWIYNLHRHQGASSHRCPHPLCTEIIMETVQDLWLDLSLYWYRQYFPSPLAGLLLVLPRHDGQVAESPTSRHGLGGQELALVGRVLVRGTRWARRSCGVREALVAGGIVAVAHPQSRVVGFTGLRTQHMNGGSS